jgi:hypothetical protein
VDPELFIPELVFQEVSGPILSMLKYFLNEDNSIIFAISAGTVLSYETIIPDHEKRKFRILSDLAPQHWYEPFNPQLKLLNNMSNCGILESSDFRKSRFRDRFLLDIFCIFICTERQNGTLDTLCS